MKSQKQSWENMEKDLWILGESPNLLLVLRAVLISCPSRPKHGFDDMVNGLEDFLLGLAVKKFFIGRNFAVSAVTVEDAGPANFPESQVSVGFMATFAVGFMMTFGEVLALGGVPTREKTGSRYGFQF